MDFESDLCDNGRLIETAPDMNACVVEQQDDNSIEEILCEDEFFRLVEKAVRARANEVANDGPSNSGSGVSTLRPWLDESRGRSSETLPRLFGGYELLRCIGQGGMGRVYLALQKSAGRQVAIKIIRPDLESAWIDSSLLDRFKAESQAAAKINHDNVIPIYDVGEVDGQHYYSMKFIEGESLKQKLSDGPLGNREAASLTRDIADGLAAIHAANFLHRDVKPSNVLVDQNFKPYLMDLGLVKRLEAETYFKTKQGTILGTIAYMSPEQAEDSTSVTPASDIYSLGAVLYSCLTTDPPFPIESNLKALSRIKSESPIAPAKLNSEAAKDLETICLKCLEKEPAARYASAQELSADLSRFLNYQPILAKRPSLARRLRLWTTRNKPVAALLGLLAVVVMIGSYALYASNRTAQANQRRSMIESLYSASIEELPGVIEKLQGDTNFDPGDLPNGTSDSERFRLNLASLACPESNPTAVASYLKKANAKEAVAVVRTVKATSRQVPVETFASVVYKGESSILPLAVVIAGLDSSHEFLEKNAVQIVLELSQQEVYEMSDWVEGLRPAADKLAKPLSGLVGCDHPEAQSTAATIAVCDLYHDQLPVLIECLAKTNPKDLKFLWPRLEAFKDQLGRALVGYESKSDSKNDRRRELNFAMARMQVLDGPEPWKVLGKNDPAGIQIGLTRELGVAQVDRSKLISRLNAQTDADVLYGVMLSLGEMSTELDTSESSVVIREVVSMYGSHPDSGVHSACDWLLRKWNHPVADLKKASQAVEWFDWRTAFNGHCLINFASPEPITSRTNRSGAVDVQTFKLEPFSIGTKEVTQKQIAKYIEASGQEMIASIFDEGSSKPVAMISFDDAAKYCNWLSQEAGLPEEQLCYRFDGKQAILEESYKSLKGFRLPTEAEWEYACAGGTSGKTCFSLEDDSANLYAWSIMNSGGQLNDVGLLRPNRFGLFDVFGNVAEWTHRLREVQPDTAQCVKGQPQTIHFSKFDRSYVMLSAPEWPMATVGFRIAQSLEQ